MLTLLTFTVASSALAFAPGPDNLFVLTQSALYGRRAGFAVIFGLLTGLIGHTLAVALGVAALLAASPVAFTALKLIGAAYLIYLAVLALRAKPEEISLEPGEGVRLGALYRRGILMNLTNPKVTIFFLAFLPQFVDPEAGSTIVQIFVLGGLFALSALWVFGLIALAGAWLGAWLRRSPAAQRWINRGAAGVLVALAIMVVW